MSTGMSIIFCNLGPFEGKPFLQHSSTVLVPGYFYTIYCINNIFTGITNDPFQDLWSKMTIFQIFIQLTVFQIYNDWQCFRYITTDHFSDAVRDGRPRPTRLCLTDHLCSGHSNPKRRPTFPIPALKPWKFPLHLHL